MIILSNGLTRTATEGSQNVASSLIRRIRKAKPETMVVTYGQATAESDLYLPLNKLFMNSSLIWLVLQQRQPVLYVPTPTRMLPAALRIFVLSRYARWGVKTLLAMTGEWNPAARFLLKYSRGEILVTSRQSFERLLPIVGDRVRYLKTGVDTSRFCPVEEERKAALRQKYSIPADKKVVLHVGHMKVGRNIGSLLELDDSWHCVLVVSIQSAGEQDRQLQQRFLKKDNVTLLETYLPDIQELYQLADVYLFPVAEAGNCIDVPLSALEAASCGIPVVATAYGELEELVNEPGFYPISSFDPSELAALLTRAAEEKISPRQSVLDYDWNAATDMLLL